VDGLLRAFFGPTEKRGERGRRRETGSTAEPRRTGLGEGERPHGEAWGTGAKEGGEGLGEVEEGVEAGDGEDLLDFGTDAGDDDFAALGHGCLAESEEKTEAA